MPATICGRHSRASGPQSHATWSDTGIQHQPRHQPRSAYTPATGTGTPHAAQHFPYCPAAAVEAHQIGHGERSLTGATRTEAIDRQTEARQFSQRTGEDGGPLSTAEALAATMMLRT